MFDFIYKLANPIPFALFLKKKMKILGKRGCSMSEYGKIGL
jgi:hypothetical protein